MEMKSPYSEIFTQEVLTAIQVYESSCRRLKVEPTLEGFKTTVERVVNGES